MEEIVPTPQPQNSGGATEAKPSPIVVKLDRHEEKHTGAATRWYVYFGGVYYDIATAEKVGLVRVVGSTHAGNKTHWDEYYEVLNKDVLLFRKRISNRGDTGVQRFRPEALKAPEEEVESIRLAGRAEEE